tara:strand:+ start:1188 stop:1598 length:411 start_codon:yes stop_codon:yes gene_type:complete
MATLVADKGEQGASFVLSSADTEIMTYDQIQNNVTNATEVNGTTIAAVPADKRLIITSVSVTSQGSAELKIYNSPNSASITGATKIGQLDCFSDTSNASYISMPCYWIITAGNYFVLRSTVNFIQQVHCRGFLEDV